MISNINGAQTKFYILHTSAWVPVLTVVGLLPVLSIFLFEIGSSFKIKILGLGLLNVLSLSLKTVILEILFLSLTDKHLRSTYR